MSVPYYGDFAEDDTVNIPFNTFSSNDPSESVTITDLADADIKVHKDGGTTEIATDGATVAINFDSRTGAHLITIDTSIHSDYSTGSEYAVLIEGTTVDGGTITAWIGAFSIERAGGALALAKALTTELAKVPKSDGSSSWNATALAAIEAEALDALESIQLDHLCGVDTTVAADGDLSAYVVDGSIMSHLLTAGADTSNYQASTDAQEAIRNYVAPASEYDTQLDANMSTRAPASEYDTEMARITANVATSAELDKVPKSDGSSSWNATALAALEGEALDALQSVQLDHLLGVTTGVAADGDLSTHVVDGSVMSHLLTAGADTSDYQASTESQEALRTRGDAAWITGGDATEAKQDTIITDIAAVPTADEVWDAIGSATSLSFETLLERAYQFFCNELEIVDANGEATLRNFADNADMATWTITDDDTTTDRTAISWV